MGLCESHACRLKTSISPLTQKSSGRIVLYQMTNNEKIEFNFPENILKKALKGPNCITKRLNCCLLNTIGNAESSSEHLWTFSTFENLE